MSMGGHIQRGSPKFPSTSAPAAPRTRAPCTLHPSERGAIPPGGPTHRPGSPRGRPARPAPAAGAAGAPGDPWPWPGRGQDAGHHAGAAASGQEPRSSEDTPAREERGGARGGLPSRCRRSLGAAGRGEGLGGLARSPRGASRGRSGGCGDALSLPSVSPGSGWQGGAGRARDASPSRHGTANSPLIQGPRQRHLPEGVSNFYVPRNHLEIFILNTQAPLLQIGGRERRSEMLTGP